MKFTAAIDEYLADMKAQGRINSPRTERSYFSRLAMHADDVSNRDLVVWVWVGPVEIRRFSREESDGD